MSVHDSPNASKASFELTTSNECVIRIAFPEHSENDDALRHALDSIEHSFAESSSLRRR